MALDRLHLGEAQRELARRGSGSRSAWSSSVADRNLDPAGIGRAGPGRARSNGSVPIMACSTASLASTRAIKRGKRLGRPLDPIGPDRADVRDGVTQVAQERQRALGLGIGHAGLGHDVDDRAGTVDQPARRDGSCELSTTGSTSTSRAARSSSASEIAAFDQEAAAGPDRPGTGEPTRRPRAQAGRRVDPHGRGRVRSGCARAWSIN